MHFVKVTFLAQRKNKHIPRINAWFIKNKAKLQTNSDG